MGRALVVQIHGRLGARWTSLARPNFNIPDPIYGQNWKRIEIPGPRSPETYFEKYNTALTKKSTKKICIEPIG